MEHETQTDRNVLRIIKRRDLISKSGFRRFHSDLTNEAELCFDDKDRPLGKLIELVKEGLEILVSGSAKDE